MKTIQIIDRIVTYGAVIVTIIGISFLIAVNNGFNPLSGF